ncbi:MAG TPA: L-threonylcarbamoyladenylate synthase [Anaerolineae bacterium]|nr:L-threonylcarbamoyladenylate synthase [Anaerolineae bacterium]
MRTIRLSTGPEDISRAVEVLRGGGIVAFPTDTVYGIGAHGMLPQAVEKLYAAKERPRDKAIPLLLPSLEALPAVVATVPEAARALAARFWPGALTIVLRRSPNVPDAVTAGGETVAVRVPDHALTLALLRALAAPLAATSANLSGEPAPDTAEGVLAQLEGRIDLILDGGRCPGSVASTVVDLTVDPPAVLRAGDVGLDALRRAIDL